jgi:hypothetical protein
VAGSGVGTEESLRLVVKLPAFKYVAGFISKVNVSVRFKVELDPDRLTPVSGLNATEDEGDAGTTEFIPITPESCCPRRVGLGVVGA